MILTHDHDTMDYMKTKRFTLDLTQKQLDSLRDAAKEHGLVIGRGPLAEAGSIQKMAEAIASDELKVTKTNK